MIVLTQLKSITLVNSTSRKNWECMRIN
jgi:hypothetical protein